MKPIISVRNLSKKYIIGENIHGRGARTFRDIFDYKMKRLFRRDVKRSKEDTTIWALKDVSFDVDQGEVVGIIGRNGAGKSTLLKILSRITEPTEGNVTLRGRVASLLEVGTGFNGELTGRENIFLNGSILGMKRTEIKKKFDEIVAFAEVEKFIDTPVKRYSSGMYVRLAFAVAAHLEPEILMVDEVLAVGDAAFQKKCLGKMERVAGEGRTVLFVSHNMVAVTNLCGHCILLDEGKVYSAGAARKIVDDYINSITLDIRKGGVGEFDLTERINPYSGPIIIRKMWLYDSLSMPRESYRMGDSLAVAVEVEGLSECTDALVGVIFKSRDDQWVCSSNTGMSCSHIDQPRHAREKALLRVPELPFTPGFYWVAISIARPGVGRIDYVDHAGGFIVTEADIYGTGYLLTSQNGFVYLRGSWEIKRLEQSRSYLAGEEKCSE